MVSLLKLFTVTTAFSTLLLAADSPFVGTWKVNAAKSKAGQGQNIANSIYRIEADGNGLKITFDGPDSDGNVVSASFVTKLDGNSTPITGNANVDAVSFKSVNANTLTSTATKSGKKMFTDRRVVSKDGKTLTVTRDGATTKGEKYHNVVVYDKQ